MVEILGELLTISVLVSTLISMDSGRGISQTIQTISFQNRIGLNERKLDDKGIQHILDERISYLIIKHLSNFEFKRALPKIFDLHAFFIPWSRVIMTDFKFKGRMFKSRSHHFFFIGKIVCVTEIRTHDFRIQNQLCP